MVELNQVLQLVKKHKNKIEEVFFGFMFDPDEMKHIIQNNDRYTMYVGDIIYKNNIEISIEMDINLNEFYDDNLDVMAHNIAENIYYKFSFINATMKEDPTEIYKPKSYQEFWDELNELDKEMKLFMEDHGDEYELK